MVLDAQELPKKRSVEEEKAQAIVEEGKAEEREAPIECFSEEKKNDRVNPSGKGVNVDVEKEDNLAHETEKKMALVREPENEGKPEG